MHPSGKAFHDSEVPKVGVLLPRLWIILLIFALPFFAVASTYLEALERTGPVAAVVSPSVLSGLLVGYFVLVYALKQRRI